MLENTGNAETKVPNSLAVVAAQAVVEQARKFQDQARETIERQRAEGRVRALERLDASRKDKDIVPVAAGDAPSSSSAPAPAPDAGAVSEPTRGTAVDLNA